MGVSFRQIAPFAVTAAGALFTLAGCNRMSEVGFDTKMALGSVSTIDRCSDFMKRAFPNAGIDVVETHITDSSVQSALVTVKGVRDSVSENSRGARGVAVECRFEAGVLTSFRWIAGPIRAATSDQAP